MVTAAMKLKDIWSLEKSYDQPRQHIKKQRYYFAKKGPSIQSYAFSSPVATAEFSKYAEYIMCNARLNEAQAGSRLPGKISITSDMQMTPPLWQKAKKS